MRVILAGATGVIGRPLVAALTAAGHEVLAVVREPARQQRVTALGARPLVADVLDREALLRAVDGLAADVVMHQATALRRAKPRVTDDDPTNRLRREGSTNLIAAARAVGATRFVTQSLITGYGYVDHGDRVLSEDDPFGEPCGNAGDPVIAGLRSAEQQAFAAEGIAGTSLRYGLFYGPGTFSDLFANLMRKRVPIVPAGGGGSINWVHIDDAASAAVAVMEHGRAGQAYNIVDNVAVTWREFATLVARAHRTPGPLPVPRWLLRLASPYVAALVATTMRVSHAKATRELGWDPAKRSVADGLRPTGPAYPA